MHSARTEPASGRFATVRGWFQRLNVRLVIALASTAAVALLVSGIALSQILPGYFLDQAARSSHAAALSTGSAARPRTCSACCSSQPQFIDDPGAPRDHRSSSRWPRSPPMSWHRARSRSTTTATARWRRSAVPSDPEDAASFEAEGLPPDSQVPVQSAALRRSRFRARPSWWSGSVVISQPYTNRVATLQRVSGTLVGAGPGGTGRVADRGCRGCAPADRARWRVCVACRAGWRRASSTSGRRASGSSRSTSWGSSSTSWPIG